MDWGIENNEFELVYYLFTLLNIGIPNKYFYILQNKTKMYNSLNSFFEPTLSIRKSDNFFYIAILNLIKKSKFIQLNEWNSLYGYRFKEIR